MFMFFFFLQYLDPAEIPKVIYDDRSANPIIVTDADGADNNKVTAVCVGMQLDSGGSLVISF
jgi:hypothetical protein